MNRPVVTALGVCHRDVELAALWLRWVGFLAQHAPQGNILVVHTHRANPRALIDAGRQIPSLTIHECPDEDESGYPKSASHLFLRTLEMAERLYPGYAVLWCEPDAAPTRPTWVQEITAEYQTCGKPNMGMLVGTQHPHQSGVSIYAADWRTRFPSIATVLEAPDYKLWGPGKGQPWDVWCRKETTPQMAETKLMFQVWKDRDARATRLKDIPAAACLFHQDKTGALIREIAAARYPEFMASMTSPRKFYFMNGHPSRLRAKGVRIRFSFSKWNVGGHRSAVCSDELEDDEAGAIAALVGQLGVREIDEREFLQVTGREPRSLPPPRVREGRPAEPTADSKYSHPSVFVMLGRYGDVCNVLPMLKAEADAGRRPTLFVSAHFADILDGVSYVDRIVWDGDYDRLPDALRWLRKEKGILSPVVCQYHRNPHDKARMTASYQKEVWRLAGRLSDFDGRGPLVFDQRDEKREAVLVANAFDFGQERPIILVGLESVSSPLASANAILRAIVEKFGDTHEVVNLSNVKATRIYDLIGLFDHAALLVSSDTVFAHLARASKVPLLALTNDGWRGSAVEHAKQTVRYALASPIEVVTRAEQILTPDSLTRMAYPRVGLTPAQVEEMGKVEVAPVSLGERYANAMAKHTGKDDEKTRAERISAVEAIVSTEPQIFHVVDVFGSDARHHVAQSTWSAAYADGITPMHFHEGSRNAKDELGDPRPLPFLKDVLWNGIPADATGRGNDIVVWSNSDVGFKPGIAAVIREHVSKHHAAAMRRTESNGRGHPGRDVFAFTVDWLHEHWEQIPDYVLGAPVFDLGLVAMIRKFHGLPFSLKLCAQDLAPADMTPGYALHGSHAPEWQVDNMDSIPSVRHNKRLLREWAAKYWPELAFTKGGNLK